MLGLPGIAAALTKPAELSGPLLAGMLVLPTAGLAAAPVNSWAGQAVERASNAGHTAAVLVFPGTENRLAKLVTEPGSKRHSFLDPVTVKFQPDPDPEPERLADANGLALAGPPGSHPTALKPPGAG